MKSKLDLAHDWAMKALDEWHVTNTVDLVDAAWIYADAMYAENEKREKIEAEEKRKYMRELLNDDNTFVEKEGQHFDDEEWQPDWSQAPDGYDWFCVGSDGGYGFFSKQRPELIEDYYFVGHDGFVFNGHAYQGHWRDSLRKRPK